jgi:amphi-Trp domain-containing protein
MPIKKRGEFELEFLGDSESVSKYLNALSEGFSKASLVLGNKKTQVMFEPQGLIDFRIKAKRRKNENKISIKFGWKSEEGKKKKKDDKGKNSVKTKAKTKQTETKKETKISSPPKGA